jgi:hypothetical protein
MACCIKNTSPPAPKLAIEVGGDVFVTAMADDRWCQPPSLSPMDADAMVMVFEVKERWCLTWRCQTVQRRKCHRFPPGTNSNPFREIPDKIQNKKRRIARKLWEKGVNQGLIFHVLFTMVINGGVKITEEKGKTKWIVVYYNSSTDGFPIFQQGTGTQPNIYFSFIRGSEQNAISIKKRKCIHSIPDLIKTFLVNCICIPGMICNFQ